MPLNTVTLEALETVRLHLINQKAQSVAFPDSGACMFRTSCGLKCAVGAIIPDEKYEPAMESNSSWTLRQRWPDLFHADLDLGPIQLTLTYHDGLLFGSRSERPEGFSYRKWIAGDETHHPDLAFAAIRKEYGIV